MLLLRLMSVIMRRLSLLDARDRDGAAIAEKSAAITSFQNEIVANEITGEQNAVFGSDEHCERKFSGG
ncbi:MULTISPECIES: hypothetical protein [unclassified Bradyrhizobium]|uniref:hypothetical protein n=1 Tax=unclassified Bradyrhizobium TaxID=2631580 RepID=UPI00247898F7|nr:MULTISPECIES: hypothetical protein [unclassified Bradyrhizobium]WGR73179.1 hypothetical protein MTX24_10250 [Bradyrhizobium sp. ISRA426]WGR78018.1 hypothetical protein MTX21_35220 [Bradyrhizobium sp. ISRA430]WGR88419.1 hypothetical protein MTX25_10260 [Bradyrhizobium sp. ISRA432]